MQYFYYYSSAIEPIDSPYNKGLSRVHSGLFSSGASVVVNLIDINGASEDIINRIYSAAAAASASNKYKIRQVFGSVRYSGWLFGRGVPALIVFDDNNFAKDVYPHNNAGKIVTIQDLLFPEKKTGEITYKNNQDKQVSKELDKYLPRGPKNSITNKKRAALNEIRRHDLGTNPRTPITVSLAKIKNRKIK